jgi:methylenetetrahydrofolate dehydrogenase (NADP+)/methenyltetrahydrofolate cyclohydrolase
MKLLNGRELAGYMEERQARQVRTLRQASQVFPKLAIIQTTDDPVIATYVRMKQRYGEDILIDTEAHQIEGNQVIDLIKELNADASVHGIIVQLPLADGLDVDEVVNTIAPQKDVDGLGIGAQWTPATAMAIDWLMAGYNIELKSKKIAIVGNGRLVGQPLAELWASMGLDISIYDDQTSNLPGEVRKAQIIVTATGVPGLITSKMIQPGAVVVDAGTASENGTIVGDVAADVREREDLIITPEKGGVGPLTVTALFDNVIRAAQATATS